MGTWSSLHSRHAHPSRHRPCLVIACGGLALFNQYTHSRETGKQAGRQAGKAGKARCLVIVWDGRFVQSPIAFGDCVGVDALPISAIDVWLCGDVACSVSIGLVSY